MEMTAKIKINVNKTFCCGNCRACRWDKDNKMKYCELYNRFLEPYHADVVVKVGCIKPSYLVKQCPLYEKG